MNLSKQPDLLGRKCHGLHLGIEKVTDFSIYLSLTNTYE
jgi:hypothetical protein